MRYARRRQRSANRKRSFHQVSLEALESRVLLHADPIKINFQTDTNIDPGSYPELTGYWADAGSSYGNRGGGQVYGWLNSSLRPDRQSQTRNRGNRDATDERYDTLNHFIKGDNHSWQIALEDGFYDILIMAGDPSHTDQVNDLYVVSGDNQVRLDDPDGPDNWDEYQVEAFQVTNGLLRLTPDTSRGGSNHKIAFLEITHRDDLTATLPAVTNTAASSVTAHEASMGGLVTDTGNDEPQINLYYGRSDGGVSAASWENVVDLGEQGAGYLFVASGLSSDTTYHYRSAATNGAGTVWTTASESFRTLTVNAPAVKNLPAQDVLASAATLRGQLIDSGNETPVVTVYWGPTDGGQDAGQWANRVSLGAQAGEFDLSITGLASGTNYFYRAQATNSGGSGWATDSASLRTLDVLAPSLGPIVALDVDSFETIISGQVLETGNEIPQITLFWGKSDQGIQADAWEHSADQGFVNGVFSATLTGLDDDTTYFYLARATNSGGTVWTNAGRSFKTLKVTLPIVEHGPVNAVSSASVELVGQVADRGNDAPFVEFFYGTTDGGTNEEAWDQVAEVGIEFSAFSTKLRNLEAETQYFFRARATNAAGISWAAESQVVTTTAAPKLLISEFLAMNDRSLNTRVRSAAGGAFGERIYPDWIELSNPQDAPVPLDGLYLTDDTQQLQKWQFPDGVSIPAGGYLVVFASGENIRDTSRDERGYLHTNFRLSSGGEFLAVTSSDGVVHSYSPTYPQQATDVSYGIDQDGQPHYFAASSPGSANTADSINFVDDTRFSHDRGFYDEPFEVEIRSDTPGVTLVYTLDGTLPTKTHGTRVAAANAETLAVARVSISTTTTLRAFAYKTGFESTNVDTQTYIFPEDVLKQATDPNNGQQTTPEGFPLRWGSARGDYQVDPDIVNHAKESDRLHVEDLKSVATLSVVMDTKDLFGSNQIYLSGSGSPRAASFELITADGSEEFQIDGSVQIQGGSSTNRWKDYKLSMRVKFQQPFGPTKLNHSLYEDSPIDRYDNITLDGVLNHSWLHSGQHNQPQYIQDQYVADLHNEMGGYSPYGRYMHVYLNGLYWGMYYVHDRPDHAWSSQLFGGEKEEYHAVKHSGDNVISNGNGKSARSSYNAMESAARSVQNDSGDLGKWEVLQERLDVDNFITYLLANWFTGNHDWPHKNWYATAHADGPWMFHSWDAEHVTDSHNDVGESPDGLHGMLDGNDEYRMRMADAIHQHFFNDGVLTRDSSSQLWRDRMDEIDRAIVGESARWGDNRSLRAHTRTDWLRYNGDGGGLLQTYFPTRSTTVLNQLRSANIYPSLDAPEFNQHGGAIPAGFEATLRNPDRKGTVYLTVDGTDPREVGGGLAATAQVYSGAIELQQTTQLMARILDGDSWSALTSATFRVGAPTAGDLVISEINYNPYPAMLDQGEANVDPDQFEFVEITNVSTRTLDLGGTSFVDTVIGGGREGIRYEFDSQLVAPGERVVVVNNVDAFRSRFGAGPRIAAGQSAADGRSGEYGGQLNDGGEWLTLLDYNGIPLQHLEYNDSGAWPGRADGGGSSLELISAFEDLQDPGNWRASSEWGGSPATGSAGPADELVINELLTHTDLPQVDQIELHNASNAPIDVSHWYVSDSGQNYFRHSIDSGVLIPPQGYLVLNEETLGFGFKGEQSDDAWLIAADANGKPLRFMDHVKFGATQNGVSIGRWPNGSGALFPMDSLTMGQENSGPRLPEIMISELNYHPPAGEQGGLDATDREFVELWNPSMTPMDVSHWRVNGAVEFDLPQGTVLPAGSGLVVVPFDPAADVSKATAFQQVFSLPNGTRLVGPYDGVLDNGGERLRLERPEDPAQLGLGYVLVDQVQYDDQSPWPISADGLGASLQRMNAAAYGDFRTSWIAAAPDPGRMMLTDLTGDLNGDGRLSADDIDALCPLLQANDTTADLNGDGATNDADLTFLVRNLLGSDFGDANLDGRFNSSDLVAIFSAGEYEDAVVGNSGWAEGDWNCDGDFTSTDLIVAFQAGSYSAAATLAAVDGAVRLPTPESLLSEPSLQQADELAGDGTIRMADPWAPTAL
ncbi:MAG: hypothetical protein GY768_31100, partial [Planctomycetaceae bacterium]|nr:hypothetical protein [Planctomycetaceae bacterium]